MIASVFHEGSGLGDQLFRYITVRTLAEEKGYEWGMINPDWFKGSDFMNIDPGREIPFPYKNKQIGFTNRFVEKDVRQHQDFPNESIDIRSYDPEINFVEDNTVIDGSFEDDKYWRHNLHNIDKWLVVEPLNVPDDLCVIGFRGGEYAAQSDLFLTDDYWMHALKGFRELGILKYEIHTDDPFLAQQTFERIFNATGYNNIYTWKVVHNQPVSHSRHTNMGLNWRTARYAKYAIVPNSAFFILPRILKHHDGGDRTDLVKGGTVTIAPRYWARRNTKTWARPACYYPEFTYM